MMKKIFKKIIVAILTLEARLVLKKYKPRIIGVTGSVGKTSTKDAIYTVLSSFTSVRKSEKSFNSDTGVPLSILGVPNAWSDPLSWIKNIFHGLDLLVFRHPYPKWLVLEIGADRPNDIKKIAAWLKPTLAIITRFPDIPAHIEFFSSLEEVIDEKASLARAVPADGFVILNHDDEKVYGIREQVKGKVVSYGFAEGATLRATNASIWYEGDAAHPKVGGLTYALIYDGKTIPVKIAGVLGESYVYVTLAALAVASALGENIVHAVEALASYTSPPGRLHLVEGIKDTTLIDDTYNSSPAACEAGLVVLGSVKTEGKRIAVLGDMLELGRFTDESHKKIGALAAEKSDMLIVVGLRAKHIAEGAREAGMAEGKIKEYLDPREAGEFLKTAVAQGDVILIKGSQGIRMERTAEMLMAHPEDKEKVLVRQEKEWLKR